MPSFISSEQQQSRGDTTQSRKWQIREVESVERKKSLNTADSKLSEYLKSTDFVPVKYMKNHAIVCQKYNY